MAAPGEAILEDAKAAGVERLPVTVEALVAAHSAMAFRIAYAILRNYHDAEDAVQECFLRVLKQQARLHEVRNPKTWVARIAWTTALDRRGSRANVSAHEDAEEPDLLLQLRDPAQPVDEQLAGEQMQKCLEQMIATLPEDLRYPLVLSTVQELNSTEIGEILHIPESSVRTRLLRARRRLKEKLSVVLEAKYV